MVQPAWATTGTSSTAIGAAGSISGSYGGFTGGAAAAGGGTTGDAGYHGLNSGAGCGEYGGVPLVDVGGVPNNSAQFSPTAPAYEGFEEPPAKKQKM